MVSYPTSIPLGQREVHGIQNTYIYRLKTNEYLHGGIRRPILDLQLWALRVARRAHRLAIIPRVVTSNMARLTCQLAAIAYFPLTEILGAKFQVDLAAIVS